MKEHELSQLAKAAKGFQKAIAFGGPQEEFVLAADWRFVKGLEKTVLEAHGVDLDMCVSKDLI